MKQTGGGREHRDREQRRREKRAAKLQRRRERLAVLEAAGRPDVPADPKRV